MTCDGLCQFCPRRSAVLPGPFGSCSSDGDLNAPYLFVGMAPGKDELGQVPFIGKSGSLLWSSCRKIGISRPEVRLMNVSNCHPIAKHGKDLSQQQINACWSRFNEEILMSKAKVVVLLGGDALRRVTGMHKIDRYRGYLFTPDQLVGQEVSIPVEGAYKTSQKCKGCAGLGCDECGSTGWKFRKGDYRIVHQKLTSEVVLPPSVKWIIATYHPSYIMRMGRKPLRAFMNDLDRARRAVEDKLEIKKHYYDVEPRPIGEGLVAFDIENVGGLDGAIDRIGLASNTNVWTAPWNHQSREATAYELSDPDRIKAAHNVQHDLKHLEAEGVKIPGKIFDTMWAGMVLEPDLPMGLRSMAPLWLDLHGCWKDDNRSDPKRYNALDAAIDRDLAETLILRHKDLGSYEALMRLVMPSLRVLLDMHRTGMKVDLEWLGKWSKRLKDRMNIAAKIWGENVQGVEITSDQQLHSFIYGRLGMDVIKDPDNDYKPTLAAWAIQLLIQRYPEYNELLRCILTYRKLQKLLDAGGVHLGADGCVHPHFGPQWKDEPDPRSKRKGTTSTLRLSVASDGGLNIQQIQKQARRMYVAPPGYVFLKADLDRAEPWVNAVLSQDQQLIDDLEHGDPYTSLSEEAGCDRKTGKALFLARSYGAGERKGAIILAKQGITTTHQTVGQVFAAIANRYKRLEWFRHSISKEVSKTGRLTSGFGFTRFFMGGSNDIPEALDWMCQHPVACILLSVLVPLHDMARSFHGWLAITVYDEAMVCVPAVYADEAARAMLDIMRTERPEVAPGFRPRVSAVMFGTNWRDLAPLPL